MTNHTTTVTDIKNLAADLRLQAVSMQTKSTTYGGERAAYLEGIAQGLRDSARKLAELASVIDAREDVAERKAEDREFYAAKAVAAGVR